MSREQTAEPGRKPKRKSKRLHFGYLVVTALVLTSFMPLSLGLSCVGIFYPSVSAYLGVGTGTLSYFSSILWIAALVTLPVTGKLLNNGNARVWLTVAVALIAANFVWLSFTQALWQFYVAGAVTGVCVGILLFLAPSTLINRWFSKRAGVLLGVVMAFTGVGGVVWSSVGGVLIDSIGWSATYRVFAVLSACTIPVTMFMVSSRPEDKGLEPVGYDPAAHEGAQPEVSGVPAERAFKTPAFYLILALCFLINIGMYVYFMIPSYAKTLQVSAALPLLGATASSVAMAGQTVSKLALGSLGEKHPYSSTIVALLFGAVGIVMFITLAESAAAYYAASLFFGFYYAVTNVMLPIFTRLNFGDRDYAKIYSRVSMVASISNAASAFLWGALIDATGGFMPMFFGVFVILLLSCVIVVGMKKAQVSSSCFAEDKTEPQTGASNA